MSKRDIDTSSEEYVKGFEDGKAYYKSKVPKNKKEIDEELMMYLGELDAYETLAEKKEKLREILSAVKEG